MKANCSRAEIVRRAWLARQGAYPFHETVPGAHEPCGFAVRLDEQGIRISLDQGVELHEVKGHLEQPLALVPGMTLATLPGEMLKGAAVVGVGISGAGLGHPPAVFRYVESSGGDPCRKGHPEDGEIFLRFVDIEMVNAFHRLEDSRRFENSLHPRPAGVVGRARHGGIFTRPEDRLGELVEPQHPESPVTRHQTVQEGGAAAIDADDEDRPHDLLACDLRVLPAFAGQLGVVAQEPAQFKDNVTEAVLQQLRA